MVEIDCFDSADGNFIIIIFLFLYSSHKNIFEKAMQAFIGRAGVNPT